MQDRTQRLMGGALALILSSGCILGGPPPDPASQVCGSSQGDERCSGGEATVFDATRSAFGFAAPLLDGQLRLEFERGRDVFRARWVQQGGRFDGLGPTFNAASCESCHARDGRAAPFNAQNDPTPALIMKLYEDDGAFSPERTYGPQFNQQAVSAHTPEGSLSVAWMVEPHEVVDVNMGFPMFTLQELGLGPVHETTMLTPRATPPVFGLGLLELIPQQDLLALADPDDADGDGISGRASMVHSPSQGVTLLGRFGWRAEQATLRDQNAAAAFNDMGLTSWVFPDPACAQDTTRCEMPELSDTQLDQMTHYIQHLAVPARRNVDSPGVRSGAQHFEDFGCASCHVSTHKTGFDRERRALSSQTIFPYTDLLLHDMGDALADQGSTHAEWRTPPLWGIGLTQTVNGHMMLLHDGRARNFEDAILWHGGEASAARDRYARATRDEQEELLLFLWSL